MVTVLATVQHSAGQRLSAAANSVESTELASC